MKHQFKFLAVSCSLLLSACQQQPAKVQTTKAQATKAENAFETYSAEAFFKTTSVFGSSINHDNTAVLVRASNSHYCKRKLTIARARDGSFTSRSDYLTIHSLQLPG